MSLEQKERQLRYVLRSGVSFAHMVFLFAMILEPTAKAGMRRQMSNPCPSREVGPAASTGGV